MSRRFGWHAKIAGQWMEPDVTECPPAHVLVTLAMPTVQSITIRSYNGDCVTYANEACE